MTPNGNYDASDAIMFGFADAHSASMAYATLQELGYAPVRHGSGELHVHLQKGDLTSALEIAMAYGGHPLDRQGIHNDSLFCSAYDIDAITIPAHLVNEDDVALEAEAAGAAVHGQHGQGDTNVLHNRDDDGLTSDDYLPGHDDYGFFSGDVRA